jgi:nucleoside-diphosphate-sugar epimerase
VREKQMSKVLVVGGAGYIGGYLTDYLSYAGHEVCVYDNLLYESRFFKPVEFVYGDIRDRAKLGKILPKFDIVIWLAAIVGDGACAIDPFLSQTINEDTVKWLSENFDGKIVFTSTCSVYGKNNDLNIDEDAPTNPLSVYASTKLAAEKHIVMNSRNYLIFRLGTLYGVGDEHSRIRLDLVVNIMTKRAASGEPLVVYGGDQWRPLMHVKDVATAIEFGLQKDIKGVYNLHYENFQIKSIADEIVKLVPQASVVVKPLPDEDARNYNVNSDAFWSYGWVPIYDLEYGIKEMWNIIKDNRLKNVDDPVYSNVRYLGEK